MISWKLPSTNAMKFNMDGSARDDLGNDGIGGVLRNNLGQILGLFSQFVGIGNSSFAKIVGIQKATSLWSQSTSLIDKDIDIVSDSSEAVSWMNTNGPGNLVHMHKILEIRHCLSILG
ncbi:hypothetical protein Dsin_017209 [Dipteronia sinensis]|uniref:RNase H type-1 domain-containing protein n=1 Tax=Dipteronia sinensis TaxID=43782 RepID=A0AAE0AFH5_9ROSI|nr:hypothetical protein Dsin_017209 [Dipteronia sinensis]